MAILNNKDARYENMLHRSTTESNVMIMEKFKESLVAVKTDDVHEMAEITLSISVRNLIYR
jgi:hypothetical protein